jgi:FHA domain
MPELPSPRTTHDDTQLRTVSLGEGTYIVGRSRSADVFINDRSASRRHARVIVTVEQTRLEDLGSKNGTLVNGVRLVGSRRLDVGDRITIGNQHFTLSPEASHEDETTGRSLVVEDADWGPSSDQTERTLDLLDVLLNERVRGREQAKALANLVVTSVDEVLDTVGATRPALTRRQAYRIGRLIGAIGVQAYSPAILAWQANARRRLDTLLQRGSYSAA